MKKPLIAIAAVAAFALSACGNPVASTANAQSKISAESKKVFDRFNAMTGTERTDALLKAAQDEGELSVYTSNTDLQDLADAFADEYDIDVNIYRGGSESVVQRIIGESRAGFRGVDLIESNGADLIALNHEGLLYPYESEARAAVRTDGQKENWTADFFLSFVTAWNTDLVKPGHEPTSLEDFTKPEWKGKVSMELGDSAWFATMWNYYLEQGKTEDEVQAMFAAIAANAKAAKGHTVQTELLSAGEFSAAVSQYAHAVESGADDGRPIAWRPVKGTPVQPVVLLPQGAGLVGSALHPAAATLFMDYLLSEGQDAFAAVHRTPAIPTSDDPMAGLETISVDESTLLDEGPEWEKRYSDLLEGSEVTN